MNPSILVVDDDQFFRQMVTDLLAQQGHRVVTAESGTAALAAFERGAFDLVLTDVVMPGMGGLELVAALREKAPQLELILVSQHEDVKTATTALRAGVADYLIKPVDGPDLVLAVDRALERANLRRDRERLLRENVDLGRYQAIHERCLAFLSSPDLEWLQERILAELTALCDAQTAALWLADERNQLVLRAYRGLLDKRRVPDRLDPEGLFAPYLKEGVPWVSGDASAPVLFVPLIASGERMGLAQLSDPLGSGFGLETLKSARTLADFAAVGLRNGARLQSLQRQGLRDRDTAAYNLSYFTDYASKEIYKARRYGRTFSLLTFSVDNLPNIRMRLGGPEALHATRGIIRALSKIIRDSDVVAKASDQEFYLLLPETDFFGAVMFSRRAMAAVRDEPEVQEVEAKLPIALVGGASTFPKDGDDFDELVHRCRRRMDERRVSLQRRLVLEPLPFWDEVELLLGSASSPRLPQDARAEPSRRGRVADTLFEEIQWEIAREIHRDPSARGILYLGGPEVRSDLPLISSLDAGGEDLGVRIYVMGRRTDFESHPWVTPVFVEGDDRMTKHQFLFWLSENAAYALIQRRGKGATWGFHTSDTAVVDGLISKLQAAYELQPF